LSTSEPYRTLTTRGWIFFTTLWIL